MSKKTCELIMVPNCHSCQVIYLAKHPLTQHWRGAWWGEGWEIFSNLIGSSMGAGGGRSKAGGRAYCRGRKWGWGWSVLVASSLTSLQLLVQILPTHPACRVNCSSALIASDPCTVPGRQTAFSKTAARVSRCMMCGNVLFFRVLSTPSRFLREHTLCLCSQFIFTSQHSAGIVLKDSGFQIWKISTKYSCTLKKFFFWIGL